MKLPPKWLVFNNIFLEIISNAIEIVPDRPIFFLGFFFLSPIAIKNVLSMFFSLYINLRSIEFQRLKRSWKSVQVHSLYNHWNWLRVIESKMILFFQFQICVLVVFKQQGIGILDCSIDISLCLIFSKGVRISMRLPTSP